MTDEQKQSVVDLHAEIGASQRKLALLLHSSMATANTEETMALVHMRKTLVLLGVAAETIAPVAKTWAHR